MIFYCTDQLKNHTVCMFFVGAGCVSIRYSNSSFFNFHYLGCPHMTKISQLSKGHFYKKKPLSLSMDSIPVYGH